MLFIRQKPQKIAEPRLLRMKLETPSYLIHLEQILEQRYILFTRTNLRTPLYLIN